MHELSPLDARLALARNGYSTIPVNGKIPHIRGWQNWHHREADVIRLWEMGYADHRNTSVLTRDNPFLDLDITHEAAVTAARDFVLDRYDSLPLRIGNAPKCGFLFQISGPPFPKITCELIAPDGKEHRIEFLGDKNQVVVHGIHPDIKRPYTWHGGSPFQLPHDDLRGITAESAQQLVDEIAQLLISQFGFTLKRPAQTAGPNGADHTAPDWYDRVDNLLDHDNVVALVMKLLRAGMDDAAITNHVRALIERYAPDDDTARKARRMEDVPRAVKDGRAKIGKSTTVKEQKTPGPPKLEFTTMADLEKCEFEPLRWIVPNYIPEGLTLLSGKPKIGKSWLAFSIVLARGEGMSVLGEQCPQGDVLYCALEDSGRRMKERGEKLLGRGTGWPAGVYISYKLNTIDAGGVAQLRNFIEEHASVRMIIIDTLASFRGKRQKDEDQHACDYRTLKTLQDLSIEKALDIIVIHHIRKQTAEDVFDTISGTQGLAAAADTLVVLTKAGNGLRLCTRGRDVPPEDKLVDFDPDTYEWTVTGDYETEDNASSRTRDLIKAALAGAPEPLSPAQVATTIGLSLDNVRHAMRRMTKDNEVRRTSYGTYEEIKI